MDRQRLMMLIPEIVQILVLYVAIYAILKSARGSRFGQVLTGVGILTALLIAFTQLFHFDVLGVIVKTVLMYFALSSVVIFQPEIRRILATIGAALFQDREHARRGASPEAMVAIIFKLARSNIGALIAFERGISLKGYETTGVELDALVSPELFFSIFTEPLPLHDGGVVVRKGRIASAHCLFPVSSISSVELSASGMRHRAAVGLSEETDALVVVVSEETGKVSVAHNGKLIRYPDTDASSRKALLRWIVKAMPRQHSATEQIVGWIRRRLDRFRPSEENAAPVAEKEEK